MGIATKNITISIPEEIYQQARVWAAMRGTSLSALFHYILMTLPENRRAAAAFPVIATGAPVPYPAAANSAQGGDQSRNNGCEAVKL